MYSYQGCKNPVFYSKYIINKIIMHQLTLRTSMFNVWKIPLDLLYYVNMYVLRVVFCNYVTFTSNNISDLGVF